MRLDRELSNYGDEAKEIRPRIKQFAMAKLEASWPARGAASVDTGDPPQWRLLENVQRELRALSPQTDSQRSALASALEIANQLSKTSWLQKGEGTKSCPPSLYLDPHRLALPPVRELRAFRAFQRTRRHRSPGLRRVACRRHNLGRRYGQALRGSHLHLIPTDGGRAGADQCAVKGEACQRVPAEDAAQAMAPRWNRRGRSISPSVTACLEALPIYGRVRASVLIRAGRLRFGRCLGLGVLSCLLRRMLRLFLHGCFCRGGWS
jgi:hypothetical protein